VTGFNSPFDDASGRAAPASITARNPHLHAPTAAEIRESQRKADEAIKVIADSTPDM